MIVQRLREIQNRFGYLPDAELHALARETGVPLYRIEEVSTFFPAFRPERDKPADLEVRVCRDYTCHLRGAADLLDPTKGLPRLERELAAALAKAVGGGPCRVAVSGVSCLGRCDRAPAVWVERHRPPMGDHDHAWVYAGLSAAELVQVLREVAAGGRPEPHWDAAYEPPSNAAYAEVVPDEPRAAGWEIDPYARDGRPRDYSAARQVAEFLKATGGRPPAPPRGLPAKELDAWVEANYPPLAQMRASGLLGMGGAGAPAYGKWLDVWQQPGPEKYVVVNGDESEPGTFKDRELLLRTPHLIVEGLIVACLVAGASAGYVYVRHEYPEQIAAVRAEIDRAEELGACGADVFGTGRPLPLAVFESPGGYICGEQSALLEAMEDRRAQPRNRPPELGANGLRDKPTAVNNVETVGWAPFIQLRGGAAYAGGGWRVPGRPDLGFGGRRLFSVSGDVRRPGVYEVPVGLPLGDLLNRPEYCGGVVNGPLKAVAPSGPSGGLLPARLPLDGKFREQIDDRVKRIGERSPADAAIARWFVDAHLPPGAADLDVLALPLDLTFFRNLQGLLRLPVEPMLGAGLAVYAGPADALDHAVNYTEFYRNESCGKCVPCRVGSQKLVQIGGELLRRRADGTGPGADLPGLVKDITTTLQQTSICGLGYVAPLPLATALAYFPADVSPAVRPDPRGPPMAAREDESPFARDDDDALIRREKETRDRFRELVTVVIDGYPVEIPRAVPRTDALGNPLRDADGGLIPRTSTIYDAAARLANGYVNAAGAWVPPAWPDGELARRVPVLCHQPHLHPVGVCRVCSVHISSVKRGKLTPGRKLFPACQHRVEKDMVVTTRAGADGYNPATRDGADLGSVARFAGTVNACVGLLADLLLTDHRHPDPTPVKRYENELERVASALGAAGTRPGLPAPPASRNALHATTPAERAALGLAVEGQARRIALPVAPTPAEPERLPDPAARRAWDEWNAGIDAAFPYSARTVVVDHDRCILCDRCARSCSEVKPFQVIGHTGKGYTTRVSFDLDRLMGESSCVQCGECMTSCPTGALSLRRRVQPRAWDDSPAAIPQNPNTPFPPGSGFLTADEMRDTWLYFRSPSRGPRVVFPFRTVPYSYLKWNEGSVRAWVIPPGTRKVICREGDYANTAFLLHGTGEFEIYARGQRSATARPGLLGRLFGRSGRKPTDEFGDLVRVATGDELVLGEMACLTHRPRNATVVAVARPDNPRLDLSADENGWPTAVADRSAPAPVVVYEVTRNLLDAMQRSASGRQDLEEMYTFRAVQACVQAGRVFRGLDPETADRVTAFLLSTGRLELRRANAGEAVVAEGDPARDFYVVRVGTLRVFRTVGGREEVIRLLSAGDSFGELALLGEAPGRRVATVAALDPAEVVRVPGEVFREMVDRFPQVREAMRPAAAGGGPPAALGEYLHLGLYQAQKVLALDLLSCTRCDECTRACADSHDGHPRLLREGLRFGDFLVATSCRSCHKPYCMEGCPVDAIHRKGDHLEVVIENHCIGCGLCERNCPYGSIQMVHRGTPNPAAAGFAGGNPGLTAAPRRAVNCDLCGPVGGDPFCVAACPHDAAFRLDGPALLDWVTDREAGR